jgi:antibiotic biosynthesis monooxygenase (ABM) superfamily enzyme
MRKKKSIPDPYAAPTKDARFVGTYEVLVPVEGRVRPHRVLRQFETKESAEAWMHSQEGKNVIAEFRLVEVT